MTINIGTRLPDTAIFPLVGTDVEIIWGREVMQGKITEVYTGGTGSVIRIEPKELHTPFPPPEPVPTGHYYNSEEDQFVRKSESSPFVYYTNQAFREKWYSRRLEFPLFVWETYGPPTKAKNKPMPLPVTDDPQVVGRSQVDGNHYDTMEMDPLQFCTINKLTPIQFCMIKHAARYPRKNEAIIDLKKVIDYAQIALEREYGIVSTIQYKE